MQGDLSVLVQDNTSPDLIDILSSLMGNAIDFMDEVGDLYVGAEQAFAPYWTGDVYNKTISEAEGPLTRNIYSTSDHFDPLVDGHVILGPMLTDKQRKWWFWFLNNVLGGDYTPKYGTGSKTPPNEYISDAFSAVDPDIDGKLDEFWDKVTQT
jgi:hypothetical protein